MAEYIVEPKSRQDIRDLTLMLRKFLGLENEKYFPITELLDVLAEIFDNFSYEIVENNELPFGTHADTNTLTGHIRIRESVYEGACNGNGRDRMTILPLFQISDFLMNVRMRFAVTVLPKMEPLQLGRMDVSKSTLSEYTLKEV